MDSFKTAKGTTFPLLDLKGKKYLQVAYRIAWFREEKPDWSIETSLDMSFDRCVAVAYIKDPTGRTISMGHKCEDQKGFGDFIEKAETGAIGRALALCGYGTQFSTELEEGERIADAPLEKPFKPGIDSSEQMPDFQLDWLSKQVFPEKSKFPNMTFESVVLEKPVQAKSYYDWVLRQEKQDYSKLREFQINFKKFFATCNPDLA